LYNDDWFVRSIESFAHRVRRPGRVKSLVQLVLKALSPGIPDFYQGCEAWDLSLVDPDNRRPVDYERRMTMLQALEAMTPPELWATLDDPGDPGLAKLWTTRCVLLTRQRRSEWLASNPAYEPLAFKGAAGHAMIGFVRGNADSPHRVGVIAPRLTTPVAAQDETYLELPRTTGGGPWRNVLDESIIEAGQRTVSALFEISPLAVLVEEET